MQIKKIKNLLEEIDLNLQNDNFDKNLLKSNIEKIKSELLQLEDIEQKKFNELKNLLESDDWPEAVLDFQIVDESSEEEKNDRAEGIVDILIEEELENKKFLDFGCGEGHIAKYASTQKTTYSVGYDINKNPKSKLNWEIEENNYMLTTDFEKVKQKAPYDIILIYDVLDHADDPVEILNLAKSVLEEKGKIYLRTHPWCGRHGGHLYRQKNKAFVHVVFSDNELEKLGLFYEEKNNKIIRPILNYIEMINKSELKIESNEREDQDVESFFKKNKLISNRLQEVLNEKIFPEFQLKQCFHDYVLSK